ncbi:hypothetical protein ACKS0A_06343 [Histoplasma ohiense]
MMRLTHARPVSGNSHCLRILGLPFLSVCSMVTTTLVALGLETRSMAPPKPLILPGSIQLAKSPFALTCMAPRIVKLTRPERIMPNDSSLPKHDAPGRSVTVSFPALIKSGSSMPRFGYGPNPRMPFSDCSCTSTDGSTKLGASMGIPMPRFAYMPFLNSFAARRTIRSRLLATSPLPSADRSAPSPSSLAKVYFSIFFSFVL